MSEMIVDVLGLLNAGVITQDECRALLFGERNLADELKQFEAGKLTLDERNQLPTGPAKGTGKAVGAAVIASAFNVTAEAKVQ